MRVSTPEEGPGRQRERERDRERERERERAMCVCLSLCKLGENLALSASRAPGRSLPLVVREKCVCLVCTDEEVRDVCESSVCLSCESRVCV